MPARSDRIYAVLWTWRKHRVVKTKAEGRRLLRVWKTYHERQGWEVGPCGSDAYRARNPENGEERAIAFHEYDAETHERVWWTPPRPKKEPAERPAARKGRKRPAWA